MTMLAPAMAVVVMFVMSKSVSQCKSLSDMS